MNPRCLTESDVANLAQHAANQAYARTYAIHRRKDTGLAYARATAHEAKQAAWDAAWTAEGITPPLMPRKARS